MAGKGFKLMNYTSDVKPSKTIGELETLLVSAGARNISKDYDAAGNVTAFFFAIPTQRGAISFRLPCNIDAVYGFLVNQRKHFQSGTRAKIREQSERVAWRILLDWVDAQLSMIMAQQVKPEQAFFAYIINPNTGQTLFEHMEQQNFLMLSDGSPVEDGHFTEVA